LKGWTNKEIANEMGLALQTVKEHFKHILEKTRTTTRTGIVMQVVNCGLGYASPTPSVRMGMPAIASRPFELASA
jgi:hypothetical protein